MISDQGICGVLARVWALTLAAASPMISMHLTKARVRTRSCVKSSEVFAAPNAIASRAASNICRRRITSLGGILDIGRPHHLVAEISAQFGRGAEIDFVAVKQARKLRLNRCHPQVAHSLAGIEFDYNVDVARVTEVRRQHRAEERKLPDAVAATEFGELLCANIYHRARHTEFIMPQVIARSPAPTHIPPFHHVHRR